MTDQEEELIDGIIKIIDEKIRDQLTQADGCDNNGISIGYLIHQYVADILQDIQVDILNIKKNISGGNNERNQTNNQQDD